MAEAASAESAAPYPKYLDWLRYLSAFLLFTYAASKMLGRQFTLPPEIALRPLLRRHRSEEASHLRSLQVTLERSEPSSLGTGE
ncbi:MAG TPA: hypothetical protein VFQ41_02945 [Candidatus Angelobacter sp.]|nr:hypothetical protein [Candidatus Angelobacter sp.]